MQNKFIVTIRKFHPEDRGAVREISCETAFIRKAGFNRFCDDEILSDVLTLYFTDYEPASCFVAVFSGEVVGYLTGSLNVTKMKIIFINKVVPLIIIKSLRRGIFLKRDTWKFLGNCLTGFLKGDFFSPDFSREYPATLHINIRKDFRGSGIGSRLIADYLIFAKKKKVKGIHFAAASEKAKSFFTKSGFSLLFSTKRAYLKYALGRVLPYYIFGKKL